MHPAPFSPQTSPKMVSPASIAALHLRYNFWKHWRNTHGRVWLHNIIRTSEHFVAVTSWLLVCSVLVISLKVYCWFRIALPPPLSGPLGSLSDTYQTRKQPAPCVSPVLMLNSILDDKSLQRLSVKKVTSTLIGCRCIATHDVTWNVNILDWCDSIFWNCVRVLCLKIIFH